MYVNTFKIQIILFRYYVHLYVAEYNKIYF